MNAHALKKLLARVVLPGSFALALSGCYETVGGDRTQPFAMNSNGVEQARAKIQQTCAYEPANYFGIGSSNTQERCACYASGVVKLMSKEEIDYYASYGLIPTLSKDKYNEVKNRCAAGTAAPAPGNKPQKQKSGKSA